MQWFWNLKEPLQLALINVVGLLGSGVVSATIAYFGFKITLKTSTAANREIAEITKSAKLDEMKRLSKLKESDYRMEWIAEFRRDSALLLRRQYEISAIKKKKSSDRTESERARLWELYYESAELKARLLMRIKQDSDDQNEMNLERLLRRSVSSDSDKAQDNRKEIRELTRAILKTEWNRVRTELAN